mgnify:CR=1 FL=1|jgi:hypothetical protein
MCRIKSEKSENNPFLSLSNSRALYVFSAAFFFFFQEKERERGIRSIRSLYHHRGRKAPHNIISSISTLFPLHLVIHFSVLKRLTQVETEWAGFMFSVFLLQQNGGSFKHHTSQQNTSLRGRVRLGKHPKIFYASLPRHLPKHLREAQSSD